jgi:hypothetical protein
MVTDYFILLDQRPGNSQVMEKRKELFLKSPSRVYRTIAQFAKAMTCEGHETRIIKKENGEVEIQPCCSHFDVKNFKRLVSCYAVDERPV